MNRKIILNSILIIITFIVAFYGNKILSNYIKTPFPSYLGIVAYSYFWWVTPTILVFGGLYGFKNIIKELGVNKGFLIGFVFSIITVLPMLLSSAMIGHIDENIKIGSLIHKTIFAGLIEEYLFRGFLFGILFRKLEWGFIPASILGALFFGLGHIYQGSTFLETAGVVLITSISAVWFSWLYIEWNKNLWVPIFLHILMNLSWVLFEVSNNALGGLYTNLFRIITIAMTIIVTIYYHKKKGLRINKSNLIFNRCNNPV